jgi:hypothetical protein
MEVYQLYYFKWYGYKWLLIITDKIHISTARDSLRTKKNIRCYCATDKLTTDTRYYCATDKLTTDTRCYCATEKLTTNTRCYCAADKLTINTRYYCATDKLTTNTRYYCATDKLTTNTRCYCATDKLTTHQACKNFNFIHVTILFVVSFATLRKASMIFMSVCLSVRPCAWNISDGTGRIFMKFYIWAFFENTSRKFKSQ